ncbi:hypothetical protein Ae356Ps1_2985 [Pseudonocardia sp. Ae356_Ps1]|nr:hypothetical protein Ae150APs1_1397 [Pseudonocardia sp. Ae150A_Ps1]OLL93088.1 hypothetical protein Ae356Ps1_2985 [Pseudonocardia sp. Ae356_Ps1]
MGLGPFFSRRSRISGTALVPGGAAPPGGAEPLTGHDQSALNRSRGAADGERRHGVTRSASCG